MSDSGPGPTPVVLVTGDSGSGKTTLLVHIVRSLRAHGLRVLTVKHASHEFHVDQPGKDSWRLFEEAGSDATALLGSDRMVLFKREESLDPVVEIERLRRLYDIVLVEGYRSLPVGSFDNEIRIDVRMDIEESHQASFTSSEQQFEVRLAGPGDFERIAQLLVQAARRQDNSG